MGLLNPSLTAVIKTSSFGKEKAGGLRAETRPPAKRKEADATGPQGGYGIRLAWPKIRAKGMPIENWASFFLCIKLANF
ncbi:MAG: hypothetical protein OET63_18130 [Desulfobacterales bacterium]|nr:hypothetical protein [Desulfobacterales bacterium]